MLTRPKETKTRRCKERSNRRERQIVLARCERGGRASRRRQQPWRGWTRGSARSGIGAVCRRATCGGGAQKSRRRKRKARGRRSKRGQERPHSGGRLSSAPVPLKNRFPRRDSIITWGMSN